MNNRFYTFVAAAALLIATAASTLHAQQLKLLVDRPTGTFTLTGTDAMNVDFAAYEITSARETLVSGAWNGLRDTEANWAVLGTPSSTSLREANSSPVPTDGAVANSSTMFNLGTGVYDASTVLADLPLGTSVESNDLSLRYYDQIADAFFDGVVEFTGERIFNNIGITIDLATGRGYLENESPTDLSINGYLLESSVGILNTNSTTFTGLGGAFEAPTTLNGSDLGEIRNPSNGGSQLLTSSRMGNTLGIDLGVVIDPTQLGSAVGAGNLSFNFLLDDPAASSSAGFIKFINDASFGDFNGDGTVDLADYTVWRDNLGAAESVLANPGNNNGTVDAGDYTVWKNNFGTTFSSSSSAAGAAVSAAAVPEPSTVMMLVASLGAIGLLTQRHK